MKQLLEYDSHSSSAEYMDHVHHFSIDENGIGGFIRVTLIEEPGQKPSAVFDVCVNVEDGDLIEQSFEIDRQTALSLIAVKY